MRNTHQQRFRSATIAENPSEDDPYEYNPSEITQELIVDPVSVNSSLSGSGSDSGSDSGSGY